MPIVLPIIEQSQVPAYLDLRPDSSDFKVWFGVIMVVILEMALISPPVGMNVFVVKGVARDVPMRDKEGRSLVEQRRRYDVDGAIVFRHGVEGNFRRPASAGRGRR